MRKECPVEDIEAEIFNNWLLYNKLKISGHIPNETYTPFKSVRGKNRRMGVRKGIPDFLVYIPADRCKKGRPVLLFIEMKRKYGVPSDVKPEQREWIKALDTVNDVRADVAFGADEAIKIVAHYLINPNMPQ